MKSLQRHQLTDFLKEKGIPIPELNPLPSFSELSKGLIDHYIEHRVSSLDQRIAAAVLLLAI